MGDPPMAVINNLGSHRFYHGRAPSLALGEGPGRIYIVEPSGLVEEGLDLTDKNYPGSPTNSYWMLVDIFAKMQGALSASRVFR
jgi:hypothetical protein